MNAAYMDEAIIEAEKALENGEIPVGAVIVKNGEIIARAHNRREEKQNALSHAETEAINIACEKLGDWRLEGCEMYVTLEPCLMCSGAIINARIKEVIFGAYDINAGCMGSAVSVCQLPNCNAEVFGGIRQEKCEALLDRFFKGVREDKG